MKLLISLLSFICSLFAHPHVFVDVYPQIMPDSLKVRWIFDEMSSNMLIMDYDFDHDGAFSSSESEALENDTFAPLEEFGYYTYFFKGEQQLPLSKARNFIASIEGSQLVFSFILSRATEAETIRFYDPDNLTGYHITETFVKEANHGRSFTVHEHDFDYTYGYILELK
jgi:ABC-type uncharacterized transport system substrate-binding protein